MKLINNTHHAVLQFGEEEAVRLLARAGFEGLDWSFFDMWKDENVWNQPGWRELALRVKAVCAECGVQVIQAHAPFPTSGDTMEFDEKAMALILRAMEAASIMGATQIVVHPRQQLAYAQHRERLFDESVALYRGLIPYCQRWNIRVCAENMWQYDQRRGYIVDSVCSRPEEFNALLDAVDSPWIIGCLDLGHSALVGVEPAEFIRRMGNRRLKALHVHDVDWKHDNHDMPFIRKLDWEEICKALAEIDYQGDFTLEADTFQARMPKALLEDANILMAKTARYLVNRIQAHKNNERTVLPADSAV